MVRMELRTAPRAAPASPRGNLKPRQLRQCAADQTTRIATWPQGPQFQQEFPTTARRIGRSALAIPNHSRAMTLMGATGLERALNSKQKTSCFGSDSAQSGALAGIAATGLVSERAGDPELAAVVLAWNNLPPAVRAGIVAMVKVATPPSGSSPSAK